MQSASYPTCLVSSEPGIDSAGQTYPVLHHAAAVCLTSQQQMTEFVSDDLTQDIAHRQAALIGDVRDSIREDPCATSCRSSGAENSRGDAFEGALPLGHLRRKQDQDESSILRRDASARRQVSPLWLNAARSKRTSRLGDRRLKLPGRNFDIALHPYDHRPR